MLCHRFTLRQTWRTVPIMFSIEFMQASCGVGRLAEAVPGQHLIELFEDTGRNTASSSRRGEIALQYLLYGDPYGVCDAPGHCEGATLGADGAADETKSSWALGSRWMGSRPWPLDGALDLRRELSRA
jgi:hypothetical protein